MMQAYPDHISDDDLDWYCDDVEEELSEEEQFFLDNMGPIS